MQYQDTIPFYYRDSMKYRGMQTIRMSLCVLCRKHPWLSMYIQGLLPNEKESLIPNDCHCGETNCTDENPNTYVSTPKQCVIDTNR